MISIITAKAKNDVIGRGDKIPWHLGSDFAYFKEKTLGHPIVMGRHTHEAIGRALPGRTNIVISSDPTYKGKEEALVTSNLDEALEQALKVAGGEEIFVIGGGMVYSQVIGRAGRLYVTEVEARPDGDKFFPKIDPNIWREVSRVRGEKTDKDDYEFSFIIYERA